MQYSYWNICMRTWNSGNSVQTWRESSSSLVGWRWRASVHINQSVRDVDVFMLLSSRVFQKNVFHQIDFGCENKQNILWLKTLYFFGLWHRSMFYDNRELHILQGSCWLFVSKIVQENFSKNVQVFLVTLFLCSRTKLYYSNGPCLGGDI